MSRARRPLVSVRLDHATVERLDALVPRIDNRLGIKITRSDAVRHVLAVGLDALDKERANAATRDGKADHE